MRWVAMSRAREKGTVQGTWMGEKVRCCTMQKLCSTMPCSALRLSISFCSAPCACKTIVCQMQTCLKDMHWTMSVGGGGGWKCELSPHGWSLSPAENMHVRNTRLWLLWGED